MANILDGDVNIRGTLTPKDIRASGVVGDNEVAIADLQQKGKMGKLKGKTMREAAPELHQAGIAGISKQKPDVPRPWKNRRQQHEKKI